MGGAQRYPSIGGYHFVPPTLQNFSGTEWGGKTTECASIREMKLATPTLVASPSMRPSIGE
jgi:hypothetical protein